MEQPACEFCDLGDKEGRCTCGPNHPCTDKPCMWYDRYLQKRKEKKAS